MAIRTEKSIGAIQGMFGGPNEVQAKPNRPIASRGAADKVKVKLVVELYS